MAHAPLDLQPGDCLLYKPKGLFGQIIRLKTWHSISHVEMYVGDSMSYASRDGQGVNLYPWRDTELAYILRPKVPLNLPAGWAYARSMIGTPYGWLDLLAFMGITKNFPGIVCSAFVTEIYRHAGWRIFPTDTPEDIAPFEFLTLCGNGFAVVFPD